jgi:iron complex outermembrane receptor protein
MRDHRYLYGCTAMAIALSMASFQAQAAEAAAPAAAPSDAGSSISELIVTAQKRNERLQDVPVAITAFSAEQRSLLGIQSVQDLTNFTPGLHYSSIDNRPYLRGVGRNTDNLATASAVATYYNGVYDGANANTILQHSDLFIDNIEVDRGPQNGLHGSNADGGTISYTSKRPTKDFYAEGRVGVESYGKVFGEAVVSGPINDWLRFRLGGNYTSQDGGYSKNLASGQRVGGDVAQGGSGQSQYLEGQLDANLGDHIDAWAMLSSGQFYTNYNLPTAITGAMPINYQANGAFSPNSFYGLCNMPGIAAAQPGCAGGQTVVGATPRGSVTAANFPGLNPSSQDPRTFLQSGDSTNKLKADIAFATNLTYHADGFDVTYLGGYQRFNYVLNFVGPADAGLSSFQLAGASSPVAGGLCALDAPGAGYNAAGCFTPLSVNPGPTLTNFEEHDEFFSHEIDITSKSDGPFQWVGGLYWYHDRYSQPVSAGVQPNQTQFAHPFYIDFATGGLTPAPANPLSAASTSDTFLNYDSYAAFFQGTYKFTDEWKATGDLRYTDDVKKGHQTWRFEEFGVLSPFLPSGFGANTPAVDITSIAVGAAATTRYNGAGVATLNPVTGAYQRNLSKSWSAWTGDFNIDWTPDRDTLVYAKYSRGYKAGGFSTYTIAANPETKAETVDDFELGLKKTINRTIQVNADVFYEDYRNDQIPLNVQNAQGLVSAQLFNLNDVHISGIELEGTWHPIDPFTLNLSYSHLDATVENPGGCFEDVVDPLGSQPGANVSGCSAAAAPGGVFAPATQNLKGNQLPEAPPNKVSVDALYTWNFDPGNLTLSGTYIWKDQTYGSVFNRPYALAPSYGEANFRLTWNDAQKRYTVIAFVNNAFDTNAYDRQYGSLLNSITGLGQSEFIGENVGLAPPRTYGLQVQYRFH